MDQGRISIQVFSEFILMSNGARYVHNEATVLRSQYFRLRSPCDINYINLVTRKIRMVRHWAKAFLISDSGEGLDSSSIAPKLWAKCSEYSEEQLVKWEERNKRLRMEFLLEGNDVAP